MSDTECIFEGLFLNWIKDELSKHMGVVDESKSNAILHYTEEFIKVLMGNSDNNSNYLNIRTIYDQTLKDTIGTNNVIEKIESVVEIRKIVLTQNIEQIKCFDLDIQILCLIDHFNEWKFIHDILKANESNETIRKHANKLIKHEIHFFSISPQETYREKMLRIENEKLRSNITNLKADFEKLAKEKEQLERELRELKFPDLNGKSLAYRTCYFLWKQIQRNSECGENGRSYVDELKPIFVLFSLCGKKFYTLAKDILGFPCFETVRNYKEAISKKYFGEALKDAKLFNGDPANIKKLIEIFYPKNPSENERKVILVIDAASIRANITLSQDGTVKGLIKELKLSEEQTKELLQDDKKFREFCVEHIDEAVEAVFVILIAPIDPTINAFPICEITAPNGSANESITNKLKEIKTALEEEMNFKVIGFGNDGDKHYLKTALQFYEILLQKFYYIMDKSIVEELAFFTQILIFYDTLHNGKNNRYFLSDIEFLYFWTDKSEKLYSVKDLSAIIDPSLLSASDLNKMDDNLALKLFTYENIQKCIDAERKDLAFALLPTTLLFQAIFEENISRNDRIAILSIGFAIILVYSYDLFSYTNETKIQLRDSKDRVNHKPSKMWPKSFCAKYLEMVYGTIKMLSENTKINLGSLGSHLIEHWFGLIRRLTQQNFDIVAFEEATTKTILYSTICLDLGISTKIEKRMSDSGVKIMQENEEINLEPLGYYIHIAYMIAEDCGMPIHNIGGYKLFFEEKFKDYVKIRSINELIERFNFNKTEHEKSANTMRKVFNGKVSGQSNLTTYGSNSFLKGQAKSESKENIEIMLPIKLSRKLITKEVPGIPTPATID